MTTRLWSVVFDANDHRSLASFWAEVLGWRLKHDDEYSSVAQGGGLLPRLEFAPVPEAKTSKNRIHLDLACDTEQDRDRIVERLNGIGARHIDIGQSPTADHVVLADPEGNEFCVCPQTQHLVGDFPIFAIAYDALDGASLGRFWSAASGWPIVHETEHMVVMRSPNWTGPYITVSGPPERVAAKPVKNRLHLDVAPFTVDDQGAEVERLVALGARRIDIGQGDVSWVVLADLEGNEFCVLTSR
jgi:predicted enzyme related to lactoylglutathione lyase